MFRLLMPLLMPRLMNAALGAWLVASAFLWADRRALFIGAAMIAASVAALRVAWARWINVPLALGLFGAAIYRPAVNPNAALNELLVSAVALFVAFVPPPRLSDVPGAGLIPH
jgi:hypothetical protein